MLLVALLPGALGILALCVVIRDPGFRETTRYSLQGIALTFIFIAAIHFPRWPAFRVLNWRPVAFVGLLSYSLYLLHYAVIFAVHHRPVAGTRGVYRVNLRHGVSRVRTGHRHTLGVIFHDAR